MLALAFFLIRCVYATRTAMEINEYNILKFFLKVVSIFYLAGIQRSVSCNHGQGKVLYINVKYCHTVWLASAIAFTRELVSYYIWRI